MNKRGCDVVISVFVSIWLILFFYESTRHFFLNNITRHFWGFNLPKLKLLYPPAGWIMFYRVSPQAGYPQFYGVKNGAMHLIDPHSIIETKTIGYDNLHRGILGSFLRQKKSSCRFLFHKFPFYDRIVVTQVYYPNVGQDRHHRVEKIVYQCMP